MTKSRPRSAVEDYQKSIGDRIRRIRRDRQMTQLELARQVGVTNGQISTIERGLSAPSIGTLRRISSALEVPLAEFFESPQPHDVRIVRVGERRRVTNPLGPEVIELLADGSLLSAVQVGLDPDQSCTRMNGRDSSELFLFVLKGHVELNCQGQSSLLRTGDSVQTDGRVKYVMKNVGDAPLLLLEIRSAPVQRP